MINTHYYQKLNNSALFTLYEESHLVPYQCIDTAPVIRTKIADSF